MILLPGLLLLLWRNPGWCRGAEDGHFTFDGDIRHIAVANSSLYIATEEKLYKLSHDLNLVQSVSLRGVLKSGDEGQFHRVSETERWNTTFRVNVLLPFVRNGTLIHCGVIDHGCGYCEVLDLRNISKVVHREDIQVGPRGRSGNRSVSFLVTVDKGSSTEDYIQTAIQQQQRKEQDDQEVLCSSDIKIVNLHNTDDRQDAGIFSHNDVDSVPEFSTKEDLEFVDGFQISSVIYLLSNVPTRNRVRLFWFEGKTSKTETLESLRGAVLSVSEDGGGHDRLVASSAPVIPNVPGSPVLWSGVFSVVSGQTSTELVVFELRPDLSGDTDADPDLYIKNPVGNEPKSLKPRAVLLRKNNMTSVLAVRKKTWMVFLVGTGDGQLIKLAVDKDYRTTCPTVLYRANDERPLFPKILLDQVDRKHVYVPFQSQIVRVPVAKCDTHTTVRDCWSAQDPDCVWCNGSSCTFEDDCGGSDWLAIPGDHQEKMISHSISKDPTSQLTLNVQMHLTAGNKVLSNFACQFSGSSHPVCNLTGPPPAFPKCTCILSESILPTEGLKVYVRIRLGSTQISEPLTLTNCSDIMGPPTSVLCQQCISAGCSWSNNHCTWASQAERNVSVCQSGMLGTNISKPEIFSITPSIISFHGKNHAVLTGRNLSHVTRVRILTESCSPRESPVWNNTGESLTFHILSTDSKGSAEVCALLPDGSCHGNKKITYQSAPLCTNSTPTSTWVSGKRKITLSGSHLDFVEGVTHSHAPQEIKLPGNSSYEVDLTLSYDSPAAQKTLNSTLFLKVANQTLSCSTSITYYPDPDFTSFTSTRRGEDVRIIIEKKADRLEMTTAELAVFGIHGGKPHRCIMVVKETKTMSDFFTCDIKSTAIAEFQELEIKYGDRTERLHLKSPVGLLLLLVLLLIPIIIIMLVIVYRRKQQKLTAEMNRMMENLEMDIRNDIRQGFVDLQTEKAELMENVGAIPFLDYKHFACRIFFPESDSLMTSCIRDIGQDAVKVQLDECCHGLSKLIQNQLFLTTMVHALEEQKSFTIKDKCSLASLLTVALHGNLSYLTEVMESLLKALMQQNSNTQPKLLLRRTESTVEKLLTNWMSICLYGYLRESVGQHLFLMVSSLTQQITKGPVDCVTEKALYTLSEDWLLWQAPHFNSLKLKVLFAVGSDGEVSEPLEVNALSCDSVEQVKEKILSTFKAKFGFPYNFPLRDVCIEFEKDDSFVLLEEVDRSSEVIGEVTMLNTLDHYKVPDGATIKVLSKIARPRPPLSPQGSLKDDENFSGKYFHLIDPDVVEDQRKNPERKKLKLKEVHLTKLLSTKVAVHSSVENLFRSIWGTPYSRALHAVKYFFDFLDAQADNMKITDPDVLHIWKTNSLPLRFWVNILKNPQFVFDMEKSPHLDGCLSVIAQAFMDSFSLSDTQLGKHAPTNKLLYAKDIPTFKQEVKAYYKQIRERSPITESEFKNFLQEESKKHENEFNEASALRELYRFIQRYFTEIKEKLDQNGAPTELTEQLHHVKGSFDQLRSCSWD